MILKFFGLPDLQENRTDLSVALMAVAFITWGRVMTSSSFRENPSPLDGKAQERGETLAEKDMRKKERYQHVHSSSYKSNGNSTAGPLKCPRALPPCHVHISLIRARPMR